MPTSRRSVLCALLSLSAWPLAGRAATTVSVEGVAFETGLQLGGQDLQLNGTGVRAVAWFKGYAAALYLVRHAASAEEVLALTGPKRLRMCMLAEVPVAEFIKAIHKGIGRNAPADRQAGLSERIERFDQLILPLGKVRKGDTVDLDFVPTQGLVFSHNGQQRGAPIAGDDFYDALLGIFIGPHPVDDALKAGLLGRRGG